VVKAGEQANRVYQTRSTVGLYEDAEEEY